jgi:hypothetical protein
MEDTNSSIYVQAKIEYTKQLINNLQYHFFDGVKSIYDDSKEIYKENSSSSQLFIFRTLLEKVPEWNNELIIIETDRIIEESKCDYLEDLLTAVFISHTKILMSISVNNGKINLTVPKLSNFIHKCYINIARDLWKNPLLFSENISGIDYQQNIKTIETIIYDCIENTIRFSLPVKDILKGQLDIYDNKDDKEKEDKEELDDNTKILNKLKELLLNSYDKEGKPLDNELKEGLEISNENIDKDTIDESPKDNNIEIVLEKDLEKPENDGYVSPEEEVKEEKSKDILINDIDEIVVDKNVYDNADIINESEKDNSELYEKLIKIKQDNDENDKSEEIIVSKIDDTKDDTVVVPISESSLNEHLSPEDKLKKEQEERNYDKIIDITDEEEKLKKTKAPSENVITMEDKKQIAYTDKKDDDTDTVDMFYEDLKNMTGEKGLSLDKVDESKYVLFDDL